MAILKPSRVVDACQSLPQVPERSITRDNLINTIERMFQSATDVVTIEGEEGIGKTTLLSQFAVRHADDAISVFVRPTSRFAYELSTIRHDLCSQLEALLRPGAQCYSEDATDGHLMEMFARLRVVAKRKRVFLILDGIEGIQDKSVQASIVDAFPVGQPGMSLILSGDAGLIRPTVARLLAVRSLHVVNFSLDETEKYLADLGLGHEQIEEIYRACGKGLPSYLASVRRSIQSGADPKSLILKSLSDLYEVEWERRVTGDQALEVLSLIAHAEHSITKEDVARIAGTGIDELSRQIDNWSFLEVSPATGEVTFVSKAFADFARKRMEGLRARTMGKIIEDLTRDRTGTLAMTNLPTYLEHSGQLKEVLSLLSPEHFGQLIDRKDSLGPVYMQIRIGIDVARRTDSNGELFRFVLQNCMMREIEGSQVSRSEVEALIALGDEARALGLVRSVALKEDRFQHLAAVARCLEESGRGTTEELRGQLRLLYAQIDPVCLGARAIDVAADLFQSCPDLALNLVEKTASVDGEENALDLAYARLSVSALPKTSVEKPTEDKLETIRSRIRDPRLRSFTSSISVLARRQSAKDVIREVMQLESATEKLYILRLWARENRRREDALEVVEFGLQVTITATGYAPNARVYRELAMPMPFASDQAKLKELVGIFDGQRGSIERRGPTDDFVRLQLLLAQAQSTYDLDAYRNRMVEVLSYSSQLEDISTRATSYAWLLSTLKSVDATGEYDKREQIAILANGEFDKSLALLLTQTAEQSGFLRQCVRALVRVDVSKALFVAKSANVAFRRDMALLDAVQAGAEIVEKPTELSQIVAVIDNFYDKEIRDDATMRLVEGFARRGADSHALLKTLWGAQGCVRGMASAAERCRALCLLRSLYGRAEWKGEWESELAEIDGELLSSWGAIDAPWLQIDTGFRIAKSIAADSRDVAVEYALRAEEVKGSTALRTLESTVALTAVGRLAIRAFAGLLVGEHEVQSDLERIVELVQEVPSIAERSELWAELAIAYFAASRSDPAKEIVSQHLFPILRSLNVRNPGPLLDVITKYGCALYLAHEGTARALFGSLDESRREDAYESVATFMLTRKSPSEPYERHERGYEVDYLKIRDVITVMNEIKTDNLLMYLVTAICETVAAPAARTRFSLEQRQEIVRLLRSVVDAKLPDPQNITHTGYAVAARAQIARIEKTSSAGWEALRTEARALPNTSDRAYVLALTARAMPAKEHDRCVDTFREAVRCSKGIPCLYDELERLSDVSSVICLSDSQLARDALQAAKEKMIAGGDSSTGSAKRRFIDTAYKIDPELAASLASISDDDPARNYRRNEMKHRLEALRVKKTLIEDLGAADLSGLRSHAELPQAAWLALGSLNAGMATTVHFGVAKRSLELAADFSLEEAYPIVCWVLENAVRRLSSEAQASATIRELFEATIVCGRIAISSARKLADRAPSPGSWNGGDTAGRIATIGKGRREAALSVVKEWLARRERPTLVYCDQYFGPEDLELLRLILEFCPGADVHILTSRRHHIGQHVSSPQDAYSSGWKGICDQDPPATEIVIVGQEQSGKGPIHDRFLLSPDDGLHFGTSWNSLGRDQDSVIEQIGADEVRAVREKIDRYLVDKKRTIGDMKLSYQVVML